MKNNLSIKQIFQGFPFRILKVKGIHRIWNIFQLKCYISMNQLLPELHMDITMRNNQPPPFFYLFPSLLPKQRGSITQIRTFGNTDIGVVQRRITHNKILPWAIHTLRTYLSFKLFQTLRNLKSKSGHSIISD